MFFLFFVFSISSFSNTLSYPKEFERMLILDSGRIKPLLTYSSYLLKGFSGKSKYKKIGPVEWFFNLVFNKSNVIEDKIFLVNNPVILEAIGFKNNRGRSRYGYNELKDYYRDIEFKAKLILKYKKNKGLDVFDNALLNLYYNLKLFEDLKGSFIKVLDENFRFDNKNLLRIIPSKDENYLKSLDQMNEEYRKIFKEMYDYYRSNKMDLLNNKLRKFNDSVFSQIKGVKSKKSIDSEIIYNKLDPFYKAEIFYGIAILMLIFYGFFSAKLYYFLNFGLIIIGFFFHLLGIVLRVFITSRPPVTDLYESLVFTSFIAVLLGIFYEFKRKNRAGLFTSSIIGLLLLLIAGKFSPQGDSIGVLVAVLDSNFWLTTHVITITLGYAGIVFSGVVSHLYLYKKAFKGIDDKSIFDIVYSSQAFGLLFSVIGTVLGGVWADQSWGRFWGWDPKENGALLIILWSAIIFHLRLDGIVRKTGFAIGSIIGVINVILAWFGVNLLGVGLHSYGFTTGSMLLVVVFSLSEIGFILVMSKVIDINENNS